jgi:hypothetical protein
VDDHRLLLGVNCSKTRGWTTDDNHRFSSASGGLHRRLFSPLIRWTATTTEQQHPNQKFMKGTTGGGDRRNPFQQTTETSRATSPASRAIFTTRCPSAIDRVAVCLIVLLNAALFVYLGIFSFEISVYKYLLAWNKLTRVAIGAHLFFFSFCLEIFLRFFYSGNCKGTRVPMLGIFSFDLFQSVVMWLPGQDGSSFHRHPNVWLIGRKIRGFDCPWG